MKIVLISGEPLFRLGFRRMAEATGDLQIVADAADARSGFRAIDTTKPEVAVVDVALAGMNGIAAIREIRYRAPAVRGLLLASWPRERDAREGFAAGARGFAVKTQAPDTLLDALRTVGHGKIYVAPGLRGLDVEKLNPRGDLASARTQVVLGPLSTRAREVLELVIKGWRNRQIARELCVSIKTVDTHRTRINRKLGCASSADLIRFAAENDLLRMAPSLACARDQAEAAAVAVAAVAGPRGEIPVAASASPIG
jgi:two-component system response regulator NreC